MNTLILPNSHSLIKEIISNFTNSVKDFSDYLIVFPGKRPSYFIRKALAQREKGSLIPPIIFSIGEFIDHVYEKELGLFEKKLEPIDSVAILFKLHKTASKPLGGNSFISADSFFPIGLKIFNAVEELYIEGIEPRRVRGIENISSKIIPEQSAGTLQSISYFYEEFIKSFDSIAGSLLKDMSFNETTGYFNFFRKYIMICRTPFEGTPVKGLQVLGFLETRNLKFSRVFILDTNEGVLPNAGKEDSLLPYKIREMLGIPTYRDREKLSAYYFDTLIKGAKEVHIFFVEKNKKDINFDEMDELADRLFKEDFGKELSGAAYLLNIQVKKRMKEFLEKYQIPLIEKNEIEIIELEHKLKTSIHSFNLKGSLDRIEKRSGKIYVIDYKTSANDQYLKINFKKLDPDDRNNWSESIGSLQLPFYLTLFTAKTGGSVEQIKRRGSATEWSFRSSEQTKKTSELCIRRCKKQELTAPKKNEFLHSNSINGVFMTLGKMAMDEKTEIPLFQSAEEALNYFPILQDIIFKLLHEIINPDIPFESVLKREKTCSFCAFHHICGV